MTWQRPQIFLGVAVAGIPQEDLFVLLRRPRDVALRAQQIPEEEICLDLEK